MSEQREMKVCRMCAMEIPAKAKTCPYCRCFEKWYMVFASNITAIVVPLVGIGVLLGMAVFLNTIFDRGQSFAEYRDQIKILDTEMVFGESTVAVVGRVKNDSDVEWEDVQFEVEFHDAAGKLVDAGQKRDFSYVAEARRTHPFCVSFKREFPTGSYVSCQVRIVRAKDAKAFF
jgi:hypothetical protein